MRLTRAALRAGNSEETPDASNLPPLHFKERALREISANTPIEIAEQLEDPDAKKMAPKKSKAKGGAKKGAKGKKGKAAEDEEQPVDVVLEDERQAAGSPASDAAADELLKPTMDDIIQVPMSDQRPASPPSRAVRMTRRQLAKQEEELSKSQRARSPPRDPEWEHQPEPEIKPESVVQEQAPEETNVEVQQEKESVEAKVENKEDLAEQSQVDEPIELQEPASVVGTEIEPPKEESAIAPVDQQIEAPEPDVVMPSVEVTSEPEPKVLTSEKPCEDVPTPATSRTASRPPSRSPSRSPMHIEQSIEAIDALEEALENVGKAIPDLDQSGDEKSPRKACFPPGVRAKATRGSPLSTKVSRNPNAAPRSLKPTAPTARPSIGRSSSVRTAPRKEVRTGSGEVTDYLASKRRPISMSFPTPPPPPKSGKAPTKATFQLPGEAIAAKLKAQKEERLRREAEGEPVKQRPISLPPPKSNKAPTKANFQLPGEAIAAKLKAQREERLRREAEAKETSPRAVSMPKVLKSNKPLTKPSFQLPGEALAAKFKAQREERQRREEEAAEAKRAAFKARPAPTRKPAAIPVRHASKEHQSGVTIAPPPQQGPPQRSSSLASKRASIHLSRSTSTSSSNRNSALITKSTVTPADAAALRVKGKEVFNRDKLEKEARDQERREKEEAAKRARAEAAERGRIASREWAEKQRKKLLANAQKLTTEAA